MWKTIAFRPMTLMIRSMNSQPPPTILSNKRQADILDAVRTNTSASTSSNTNGSCSITDLAKQLNVSDETIRRNVKSLVSQGLVEKIRGGVMMPSGGTEPAFPLRMNEGREAKQRIAAKIASQIKNGESLILDNSSTTAYIAHALTNHENLLVVTNSVIIAGILATKPGNRVFMAGGELLNHNGGAFGPETLEFVKKFEVQSAIFSAAALHPTKGFLIHHLCEAEFARAITKQCERTYIAADSRKFGRKAPLRLCELSQIDELVTDKMPPDDLAKLLTDNEIDITVADGKSPFKISAKPQNTPD